jgi:hypothetical protein
MCLNITKTLPSIALITGLPGPLIGCWAIDRLCQRRSLTAQIRPKQPPDHSRATRTIRRAWTHSVHQRAG